MKKNPKEIASREKYYFGRDLLVVVYDTVHSTAEMYKLSVQDAVTVFWESECDSGLVKRRDWYAIAHIPISCLA